MQILTRFGLLLSLVVTACVRDNGGQSQADSSAVLTARAWLVAIAQRDSTALDSRSVHGSGLNPAERIQSRGTDYLRAFASREARVEVASITGDSAYLEVYPETGYQEPALGFVLSRAGATWQVVNAAPFRRN